MVADNDTREAGDHRITILRYVMNEWMNECGSQGQVGSEADVATNLMSDAQCCF